MGVFIWRSKKGKQGIRGLWLLSSILFASNILYSVLHRVEFEKNFEKDLGLLYLIPLSLFGLIVFWYNRMILRKVMPRWPELLLHLIAFITVLILFGDYFILSFQYSALVSILLLMYAFGIHYFFLKHFRNNIHGTKWIKTLNILFIVFSMTGVLHHITVYYNEFSIEEDYLITGSMTLIILICSYLALKRPEVLFGWENVDQFIENLKYKNSGLTKKVSLEYKRKLLRLMESEKPYLNPAFKLNDLAELLGLSRHNTSQLINEHFQNGFFDFINHYRITSSCSILLESKYTDPKKTIIEAAYNAGFNSKASFYKAFKKFVGTTPSEYIKDPGF